MYHTSIHTLLHERNPFITPTYYHPTIAHFVPKITISFGHTQGLGLVPGYETPGFGVQD
jgi:hypothetical protein